MKTKYPFKIWFGNLPFYLIEVFICNLFGHKPDLEITFFGMTLCQRCYAKMDADNN